MSPDDISDIVRKFTDGEVLPAGIQMIALPARDPSVRDVLARLDEIEAKLDELNKSRLSVEESTAAALGVIQLATVTWLQNKTDHA